jgi:hypothetical protein
VLTHNLILKPALTEVFCISHINIIYYNEFTKCECCPQTIVKCMSVAIDGFLNDIGLIGTL